MRFGRRIRQSCEGLKVPIGLGFRRLAERQPQGSRGASRSHRLVLSIRAFPFVRRAMLSGIDKRDAMILSEYS